MAFEDAETLAYTMSRIHEPNPEDLAKDASVFIGDQVTKWQNHRGERITKVVDFTTKNGNLRKSSAHVYEQAAKEWVVWAAFKWMGPEAGARWMYGYNAESVLSALV